MHSYDLIVIAIYKPYNVISNRIYISFLVVHLKIDPEYYELFIRWKCIKDLFLTQYNVHFSPSFLFYTYNLPLPLISSYSKLLKFIVSYYSAPTPTYI